MKLSTLSAVVFTSAITSTLSLTGCMNDADELTPEERAVLGEVTDPSADPGLSETSQQLTAWGIFSATCSASFCATDLGTTTARTCFLGGLGGDLRNGFVYISRTNGNFRLEMHADAGKSVAATAICINGNTNFTYQSWFTDTPANQIFGTVTSKRRCFLSGVLNTGSYNALDNSTDYVKVWKDAVGQWWLGGSVSGAADALITATCVDTDAGAGLWGAVGPTAFDLAYDPGSPNGVACGVTKLGGSYINGASDGIQVGFNGGTRYWNINADANKNAEMICVK